MENEVYENNVTTDETEIENFDAETEDTGSGVFTKMILGGTTLAIGVAGGLIFKNREKILGKVHEVQAKKLDKKVEKAKAKLAKLEAKQAPTEAEKKE